MQEHNSCSGVSRRWVWPSPRDHGRWEKNIIESILWTYSTHFQLCHCVMVYIPECICTYLYHHIYTIIVEYPPLPSSVWIIKSPYADYTLRCHQTSLETPLPFFQQSTSVPCGNFPAGDWIWFNQQHPSLSAKPTLVQDASTYLRAEVEPYEDDDVSEDTKEQQDGPCCANGEGKSSQADGFSDWWIMWIHRYMCGYV